jgi:hypothetical protein
LRNFLGFWEGSELFFLPSFASPPLFALLLHRSFQTGNLGSFVRLCVSCCCVAPSRFPFFHGEWKKSNRLKIWHDSQRDEEQQ